jgi:Lar family restriction alleviation protein
MSDNELKPCPFCGGDFQSWGSVRDGRALGCSKCGARFVAYNGPPDNTAEDRLVTKWNTRAADATIARLEAENARMRSLLSVADAQIVGIYSAATPGGNYEFGNRFEDNDPVVKEIRSVLTAPDPDDGTPKEASE